jgi:predicted ABC-type ATPase
MPEVVVLAGPNGAGKSTAAPAVLRNALLVNEFVNADTIAAGLSAFSPEAVAVTAGRVMLERIRKLARERRDFAFETTLASRTFAPWLRKLQSQGYRFHLIYLWLPTVELAVGWQRVTSQSSICSGGTSWKTPSRHCRRRQRAFSICCPRRSAIHRSPMEAASGLPLIPVFSTERMRFVPPVQNWGIGAGDSSWTVLHSKRSMRSRKQYFAHRSRRPRWICASLHSSMPQFCGHIRPTTHIANSLLLFRVRQRWARSAMRPCETPKKAGALPYAGGPNMVAIGCTWQGFLAPGLANIL